MSAVLIVRVVAVLLALLFVAGLSLLWRIDKPGDENG